MQFRSACPKSHEMCDKAVNDVFLNLFIFLIDIKLKNCVKVLFLKILLSVYWPNEYKIKKCEIKLLIIV